MVDLHPFFVYALMLVAISFIASAIVTLYKLRHREGYQDISDATERLRTGGDQLPPTGDTPASEQPQMGDTPENRLLSQKKAMKPASPTQQDPVARAAAINAMASASQPIVKKFTIDDKITEINLFILNQMIYMADVFDYVPKRVDSLIDQSQELTDQTCQLVREIESRYVGRPKAEAEERIAGYKEDEPDDNLNDWTYDDKTERRYQKKMNRLEKAEEKAEKKGNRKMSKLKQKYRRKKKQFQNKFKDQPMLECFVGNEDVSGANIFQVDKYAPITSFGPPIVGVTDLSGNIITGKNLADAMKNKHIQENKQILKVEVKLLKRVSDTNELVKSREYTEVVEKLKRVPITATFSEQFVKKYLKSVRLRNLVRNIKGKIKGLFKRKGRNKKNKGAAAPAAEGGDGGGGKKRRFGRRKKEGFEDYDDDEEGFEDYDDDEEGFEDYDDDEEGFEDYDDDDDEGFEDYDDDDDEGFEDYDDDDDEGFEDYDDEEGFDNYEGFAVYQNKRYNFPVPYKDIELDDEQRLHLKILSNAYELKIKIQIELAPLFNTAKSRYNSLSASYGKMKSK